MHLNVSVVGVCDELNKVISLLTLYKTLIYKSLSVTVNINLTIYLFVELAGVLMPYICKL